ncbi:polymorphic toxin type 34 domain-containing protein [Microcoleus sp. A006_D1]|uniref:polymorphic toxin type 34 domain-containing protein n=1 Tax=Microcoleus sp. A006_D1 TaxID=3055267 RepID=UPI002FD60E5D
MTSEGNVADTGIVEKANQLIQTGQAPDMLAALKILKEQARQNKDKAELDKIKTTQKAFDDRKAGAVAIRKRGKRQRDKLIKNEV